MLPKAVKSPAIGLCLGLAVGVLMVILAFAAEKNPDAMKAWNGVNAPALWGADYWTHKAGLPPRGEIASLVVPSAMVLAQWSVIGLLAGLGWAFKPSGKLSN